VRYQHCGVRRESGGGKGEAEWRAAEEKAASQKAEAAEKAYKVGRDFYDIRDYDSAISRLSEYISFAAPFVANDSQNADAYRCRGGSHWAKKRYDEAIKDFNIALNIEPKSAFAYERRGDCYFNKGQYEKATGDFNIALNIDPGSAIAKEGLNAIAAKQAAAKAAEEEAAAAKKASEEKAAREAAEDKAAAEKEAAEIAAIKEAAVGSIITFGKYQWLVLDIQARCW